MHIHTLRDLYIDELKDVYDAEQQILVALPKMAEKANSPDLKMAFTEHEQMTRGQVERLEQIFQKLGESPTGKSCKALKGLVVESEELMKHVKDPEVLDAALIGAAQKVEHYEIASYGTLRTFARMLGDNDAATLLDMTAKEEGETDHRLTALAERHINRDAADTRKAA